MASAYKNFDLEYANYLKANKNRDSRHLDIRPCSAEEVWENFKLEDLGTLINFVQERHGLSTNKIAEEVFGINCRKDPFYEDNIPPPNIPETVNYPSLLEFKKIFASHHFGSHSRQPSIESEVKIIDEDIPSSLDENSDSEERIYKSEVIPKANHNFHLSKSPNIPIPPLTYAETGISPVVILPQPNFQERSHHLHKIDHVLKEDSSQEGKSLPDLLIEELNREKIPPLPSGAKPAVPPWLAKHPPRSNFRFPLPNLKPPDGIEISILTSNNIPPIKPLNVTLAPSMSTYDVLYQAAITYQDLHRASEINPYRFSSQEDITLDCHIISGIADISNSLSHEWQLTLLNKDNEILSRGPCIPPSNKYVMRPGYKINLEYVNRM